MSPAESVVFARVVYAAALSLVRSDWRFIASAVAIATVPRIVASYSLALSDMRIVDFILSLVVLYLQLLVTFRTMASMHAAPPGYASSDMTEGRFPSAFAANLLQTTCVIAGLVILVIPGVILYLLWSLSIPAIAAERLGATDALRRSWHLARPALWGVAAVTAILISSVAAGLLILTLPIVLISASDDVMDHLLNLWLSIAMMVSPVIWAVAYLHLRQPSRPLPAGRGQDTRPLPPPA